MRRLDRWIQLWRVRQAARHVAPGDRLLDVGCFDRTLIDRVRPRIASAIGVDPEVAPQEEEGVRLVRGVFPGAPALAPGSVDCVTALAVLEHVEDPAAFAAAVHDVLAPGGRAVLTVPHPLVDVILDALIRLRLADGMAAEEHHGFDVGETVPLFEAAGLRLVTKRAFQLGLNRLFVFEKPRAAAVA